MRMFKKVIGFSAGFTAYYVFGIELVRSTIPWVVVNFDTSEEAHAVISWAYWILGMFQGSAP